MKFKLMKLIRNEIKKILKSKKYIVAMVILLVLYIGMTFLMYKNTKNLEPEVRLKSNKSYMEYLQGEKSNKDISEKRKGELDNQIKEIEIQNKDLEFEVANINLDWHEKLTKHNIVLKEQLQAAKEKENTSEIAVYKGQLASNEYYLTKNIRPTSNYEVTALNILPNVNAFIGMLIISLIVAIITSDSISGEFNPATIKLFLTKPVSREKVLFAKFTASVLTCIISFIVLKLIIFLAVGIIFSFGNFKDPISFYTKYVADKDLIAKQGFGVKPDLNSLKIYSAIQFTVISEALNLLYITACASVCFLISTLTKKAASSISISVIFLAIVSIFVTAQIGGNNGSVGNATIHKLLPYLFSTYSSGELVFTREIVKRLGMNFVNIPFIVLVLLTWTLVCYAISNFVFVKRDILS